MWYGDKLWNGYCADCTNGGMTKAGIEPISARGIVGRCVLLDLARFRGREALRRAETFDHNDLLACSRMQGVEIAPRTILVLRTGWLGALLDGREAVGPDYWEPGLTFSRDLVAWFDAMQIPCLVTDTLANETTYEPRTGVMLPLHGALDAQSRDRVHGGSLARRSCRRLRAGSTLRGFFLRQPHQGRWRNRRVGQSARAEIISIACNQMNGRIS